MKHKTGIQKYCKHGRHNMGQMHLIMLAFVCSFTILFTGCFIKKEEAVKQNDWVDQMNNTFSDDHFEYGGPAFNPIGGQSPNCAIVKSEKYPQEEIQVLETEKGLFTNYNKILYETEAEEYFAGYFSGKFECDGCEAKFWNHDQEATPIIRMTADEYIRDYVQLNEVKVIIYRKDGIFPDKDDMTEILISICKERNEVCNFTVYCCKEKTTIEEAEDVCECYFELRMDTDHSIRYSRYKYKDDDKSYPLF